MDNTRRLQLKTIPVLLICISLAQLGNVLLGKAMKGVGALSAGKVFAALPIAVQVLGSGYFWLGIGCLLIYFVADMMLLTWADYSYVQPASALSYLVISILSYLVLREAVSPLRWLGVTVICAGVFVVSRTPPNTTGGADGA